MSEKVVLSEKRRGEIALALLKREAEREGIKLNDMVRRNLGNVSKETGIPVEELKAFGMEIVKELTEKYLG
jgi:hypothetical protein